MNSKDLEKALVKAAECIPNAATPGQRHQQRSREWVKCLGSMFREILPRQEVVVFVKDDENKDFKLNELLFDVCVCETSTIPTKHASRGDLKYVTKALWLVESEFDDNFAEAVKDFSKLVIGASENKLFVGPKASDGKDAEIRERLLPIAERCRNAESTNVYFAQISHPGTWSDTAPPTATLWKLNGARWDRV